jgi:hypothetical protein
VESLDQGFWFSSKGFVCDIKKRMKKEGMKEEGKKALSLSGPRETKRLQTAPYYF